MLTLTRADLNLLKTLASNQNSSIKLNDSSTAKYQQRHELSNKRVEKWPNTLEAIRKKKEEFLIEKDKERERKNAELDRQEKEFRALDRKTALERAAKLQNDQTEEMKFYRSQQLSVQVLDTVADQLREKDERKRRENQQNEAYHQLVLKQVQTAECMERTKIENQKRVIQSIAVTRAQQRDEAIQRKEKSKLEQRLIGEALQHQAKQDLADAKQNALVENTRIKAANEAMILYNESLKSIRSEIKRQESVAQNLRDGEAAVIERRHADRKHIDTIRQENRNKKRADLIETASLLLQQTKQKEEAVLDMPAKAINQRQEDNEAAAAEKKRQEWEEIAKSRLAQVEAESIESRRKRAEDDRQIKLFLQHNQLELEKETEKQRRIREATVAIKQQQYSDGLAMKAKNEQLKVNERTSVHIMSDKHSAALSHYAELQDDCMRDIEARVAEGRPVYPLLKVVAAKRLK